jgi:hypothetical protein
MSGVRKTTRIAAETGRAREQADHRLAVATFWVRPFSAAAYSCSLKRSLRSSRPPFHFLAAQAAQICCSGLILHGQDVKA